ncbi:MAG: PilZ domain-containing protein [Treponema sp.]|nr:PilZ domain-containing protein [Treponema sp.]
MNNVSEIQGRKIFFLHPAVVVQNQIVAELVQQEFEVYLVKDHDTIRKAIGKYPDSIIFVDINEMMAETEWEKWIRGMMKNHPDISVGIITANHSEDLMRKYINSVKVDCGYTVLKADLKKSIAHILEILLHANAKGRRKYIRANTENETSTTLNLPHGGSFINGVIKDISVVGMSCSFDHDPELAKNSLFRDIQIKLQSMLLKTEGIVFGSRMDSTSKIYVFLFTQRIDPEVRTKIRKYIQHNLQSKMDTELK